MLGGIRREWPITVVVTTVVVGLGVVASGHFRRGTVLLSFGIALALFLRMLLPTDDAGLLAVRSKRIDIAVLAVLALATSVLALWVPPPSN
jgi:hypothetical protein